MKQKILSLFLSTLLIVTLLGSVGAEAAMHDGNFRANPWEDSGLPSSFQLKGSSPKYMDFLVPYNITVKEMGGYPRALWRYRNTEKNGYTYDIFYESSNFDKRFFGQSNLTEFGPSGMLNYMKSNSDHERSGKNQIYVSSSAYTDAVENKGTATVYIKGQALDHNVACIKYDATAECLYLLVNNSIRFYFGCFTMSNYKLGSCLAKHPETGVTLDYFDIHQYGGIYDLYLVDGTCIHFVNLDTFGAGHSIGCGTVTTGGKVTDASDAISVDELASQMTGRNTVHTTNEATYDKDGYTKVGADSAKKNNVGFYHPTGDGVWTGSEPTWHTEKLYWYADNLEKMVGKNGDGVQDGCTFGGTYMENFQYAYSAHANGIYMNEANGVDSLAAFAKAVYGWSSAASITRDSSQEDKDKRFSVIRAYDFSIYDVLMDISSFQVMVGLENNGFPCGKVDANFTGTPGYTGGGNGGCVLTDTQRQNYVKALASEWKTINTLLEQDLSDLFVTEDSLMQKDRSRLEEWADLAKEDDTATSVLRLIVQIVGIVVLVWGILFYLAYWFDTLNTFVEFSFISVLTMGKLVATNDDNSSDKNTVTHKKALITVIITTAFAVSLISGLIYKFLIWLIMGIKSLLG